MAAFILKHDWPDARVVKFRQPFDLIAVGVTESKRMKAAEVGSGDLHQEMYTLLSVTTFWSFLREFSPLSRARF